MCGHTPAPPMYLHPYSPYPGTHHFPHSGGMLMHSRSEESLRATPMRLHPLGDITNTQFKGFHRKSDSLTHLMVSQCMQLGLGSQAGWLGQSGWLAWAVSLVGFWPYPHNMISHHLSKRAWSFNASMISVAIYNPWPDHVKSAQATPKVPVKHIIYTIGTLNNGHI